MKDDIINHPNHYTWLPGIECIDVAQWFPYNLGCSIKYIWRAGRKEGNEDIQDLRKAVFYLHREIERRILIDKDATKYKTPTVLHGG